MKIHKQKRDIFAHGELSKLADSVFSGVPTNEISRLSNAEMRRIPEIVASVNYKPDDLWQESIIDFIDNDELYTTRFAKKEVLGRDIKSIILLMYLKPRTSYWKPDKPQIYDSSVCGGVPLPLLGFRDTKNITYDAWRREFVYIPWLGSDTLIPTHDEEGVYLTEGDLGYMPEKVVFNLDLLLGKTLASTSYDLATGEIKVNKDYGLALLSCFNEDCYRPNYADVQYFRAHNMGNHKGSFASAYGTAKIPAEAEDGEYDVHYIRNLLHNDCSTPMRLMLSQRWAWYRTHRNSDMILDFQDWSNIPKSADDMSVVFKGQEPSLSSTESKLVRERFGL